MRWDAPQNAFLNIHGRIIATFEQLEVHPDEYLILVENSFVNDILDHVRSIYKVGRCSPAASERTIVYHDLDRELLPFKKMMRLLILEAGRLVISNRESRSNGYWRKSTYGIDWEITVFLFRVLIITDEMLLNVSTTDYVSFTKGCFLGQEPISKVYNRSKPTWRLVVKSENECSSRGEK